MGDADWLADLFLAELPPVTRGRIAAASDLADTLAAHLARARSAWPELAVSPEAYVRHLAAVLPDDPDTDLPATVRALHAADLYLALACAERDPAALAALESHFIGPLSAPLRAVGAAPAVADEIRQRVREILLVGADDRAPGIAGYRGRAQLRSWIRSVAIRQAMRSFRDRKGDPGQEPGDLDALPDRAGEPELAAWKRRYAADFEVAFEEAIGQLGQRERTLLRQHYLEGQSLEQLAELHRVHRATAARWLAAARSAVLDGTRERLGARLRLPPGELDSIVRLIRSQIDLSLGRMLR